MEGLTTTFPITWGSRAMSLSHRTVNAQLADWYKRHDKILPHIPKNEQEKVVWLLRVVFAYTNKDIENLLHICRKTIVRRFETAEFTIHRRKNYEREIHLIYMHIIYSQEINAAHRGGYL